MDNGTGLEWSFLASCLIGFILGGGVFTNALMRLVWRYRTRTNGGILLLAWERMITSSMICFALLVGVGLGILLVLIPPADQPVIGEVERWARGVSRWFSIPALLILVNTLSVVAVWTFIIDWRLDRYFAAERVVATADNHPHRRRDDPPPPSAGVH